MGANCKLPECKLCPKGFLVETTCIGKSPATCKKNLFKPINHEKDWSKNAQGKWTHSASKGTITNTGAGATWLIAGWTGQKFIEKVLSVDIQEIAGPGRLGKVSIGHPGIIYHYLNDKNWEGFHFRPHSTGTKSAIQFVCHVNGKGTYPAGNKVKVPTNGAWFNAKVTVTSTKATSSGLSTDAQRTSLEAWAYSITKVHPTSRTCCCAKAQTVNSANIHIDWGKHTHY